MAPSMHLVQGPEGRGYVAMASHPASRQLHLYGNRRQDLTISWNDWYRVVMLDNKVLSWNSSNQRRQRNRLAYQSAALLHVLVTAKPDERFTPRQIFERAFSQAPTDPEVSQVSDMLAVLEGADLIEFDRTSHSRTNIHYG